MKKIYNKIAADSLYRNSSYLLFSNVIIAVFGFAFCTICTRVFTPHEIGLASTLISSADLMVAISLMGLNMGLVRFLPNSDNKNKEINTVFCIVVLASFFSSIIFIFSLKYLSPELKILHDNIYAALIFLLFVMFTSVSEVLKDIFRAFRSSQFVLFKNFLLNLLKLSSVFLFLSYGAIGLFSSWLSATITAVIISFIILFRKFGYIAKMEIKINILKKIFSFSFANYINDFLERVPRFGLPLMITTIAGPEKTAFYYIDMSIASFLYLLPEAIVGSFYAESSTNESDLRLNIQKTLKAFALILIPATLVFFFFGNKILLFFGKDYSDEGFILLRLLSFSTFFVAINSLFSNILKIKFKMKSIFLVNLLGTITILTLSVYLLNYSLVGVGWAWLAGNTIMSIAYLFTIIFLYKV